MLASGVHQEGIEIEFFEGGQAGDRRHTYVVHTVPLHELSGPTLLPVHGGEEYPQEWQIFQPSWLTARTPPQRGHCSACMVTARLPSGAG
ncbi:hypothetical protein GCM10010289_37310 [Streptomyces violascens]|uniref:Uncharacterized protein n=1 Tax=Streptomyces violascens TaxID=67381 RepID=A0ABQ3QWY7_9ACTN|nr:hypothetical protein GCM10010289_37310 [Streptomyces violascens]GHI41781.1 hypothetical protein Sviol_61890 [Streptomyces violascens]